MSLDETDPSAPTKFQQQDRQYEFPYHYIPRMEGGVFRLSRTLRWGYEYLSYIQYIVETASRQSFGRLLDVGCGDGRLLYELAKRSDADKLFGVDLSESAIVLAKHLSPSITFANLDIIHDRTLNNQFDAMTCSEVLEHIPPNVLPEFVRAMRRKSTDNGILWLTVPSTNFSVSKKHFQHFDSEKLRETLEPAFEIERIEYLNSNRWFVRNVIENLFTNRYFAINHPSVTTRLYRFYCRRFLKASPSDGRRLFAICRPALRED